MHSLTYTELLDFQASADFAGSYCYISQGHAYTVIYHPSWPANRHELISARQAAESFFPRLSLERARTLRPTLELPRTTEAQAQAIAGRLNQKLPYSWTSTGTQYRVLNHYPSGSLYLALIRK